MKKTLRLFQCFNAKRVLFFLLVLAFSSPLEQAGACQAKPTCTTSGPYFTGINGCPQTGSKCMMSPITSSTDWQCTGNTIAGCTGYGSCTATVTTQGQLDGCAAGGVGPTPTPTPTGACQACPSSFACRDTQYDNNCNASPPGGFYCSTTDLTTNPPDTWDNGNNPYCSGGQNGGVAYNGGTQTICTQCGGGGSAPTPTPTCQAQPTCTLSGGYQPGINGCPPYGKMGATCIALSGGNVDWQCTTISSGAISNSNTACPGPTGCTATVTTQGQLDGCAAGGGGPSPTPTGTTPTPTPSGCSLDIGGTGRACTLGGNTCCTGYTCVVAGDQPVMQNIDACPAGSASCIYGVNWANNISGNGADALTSGMSIPSGSATYTPSAMCVPSSDIPAWGESVPTTSSQYDLLTVAKSAPAAPAIDTTLLTWNSNTSYFVCNLQSTDKHRQSTGCSCSSGYEPFVIPTSMYNNLTYNIHMGSPRLDVLWENVLEAMKDHPLAKASLEKVVSKAPNILQRSVADSCGAFTSNCSNDGVGCAGFGGGLCQYTCGYAAGSSCPSCILVAGSCTGSGGGSTPTPTPVCTTCTCGFPSSSAVTSSTTPATPTNNTPFYTTPSAIAYTPSKYADSCGNIVCSYSESCMYVPFFGAGAPTAASEMTCTPVNTPTQTSPNVSGCGTHFVNCPQTPPNESGVYWGHGSSYSATGGGNTTCIGGSTPTPTPTSTCPSSCLNMGCSGAQFDCVTQVASCSNGSVVTTPQESCQNTNQTGSPSIKLNSGGCNTIVSQPTTCTSCTGCAVNGANPSPTTAPTTPPTATATPGTTAALYTDSGAWASGFQPWASNPVAYGILQTAGSGNPDISQLPNTEEVACIKACPSDTADNPPLWTSTHLIPATPGATPTCQCSPSGYSFDQASWQCVSCPTNSVVLNGACQCPQGYTVDQTTNACVPKLPVGGGASEYIATPYPVCAQGSDIASRAQNSRMPSTYGLQVALNVSGTSLPRTSDPAVVIGTNSYPYSDLGTNGSTSYPIYKYANLPHCACMGTGSYTSPLGSGPPVFSSVSGSGGDTLDYIASFNSSGIPNPNKPYGMVAIALDGVSDGRSATNFNNSVNASCGCPNVNEYPVVSSSGTAPFNGVVCKPSFTDPNQILATYNPATDNVPGKTQVLALNALTGLSGMIAGGYIEPTLKKADGALKIGDVVPTISLPTSQSAPSQLAAYNRRIWKCQIGYTLNLSTMKCDWGSSSNDHQCDSTSPVASGSSFVNIINKKLACCMNDYLSGTGTNATQTSGDVKFDCIDNSAQASDFNTLWQSGDAQAEGGQMNAIVLAAGNGKPLTGFYTLDGARCNDFSEFDSKGIQPGMVNPSSANTAGEQNLVNGQTGNQFQANGALITPPTAPGFAAFIAAAQNAKKNLVAPHPETGNTTDIQNARRCPILVRAAMVASCPAVSTAQNAVKYTVTGNPVSGNAVNVAGSSTNVTRCPVADHIQIHIRAEQVWQIAGSPAMQTVDTVVDNKDANSISLDQIIRQKNGSTCLPGMTSGSSGCHY